jgi:hypothetical protein
MVSREDYDDVCDILVLEESMNTKLRESLEDEKKKNAELETKVSDLCDARFSLVQFIKKTGRALKRCKHKYEYEYIDGWTEWALQESETWVEDGQLPTTNFREAPPESEPSSSEEESEAAELSGSEKGGVCAYIDDVADEDEVKCKKKRRRVIDSD